MELIELLHDFGKYTQAFQDVLKGIRTGVDHAMGGATQKLAIRESLTVIQ